MPRVKVAVIGAGSHVFGASNLKQALREQGRDPTIENKAAGIRAIDACLEAHADLLPEFGD